jgi:hypothetical protein
MPSLGVRGIVRLQTMRLLNQTIAKNRLFQKKEGGERNVDWNWCE